MAGMIWVKTHVALVSLLAPALLSGGVAQGPAPRDQRAVSLVLAVKADGPQAESSVARTAAVLRRRCAGLRIRCDVRPQPGDQPNRLLLRFSPAADAARVVRVLLARGLELRAVVSPLYPYPMRDYPTRAEAEAAAGKDADVFPLDEFRDETYIVVERANIITGDDVRDCKTSYLGRRGSSEMWDVNCRFREEGAARMKAWTSANIYRYIAVVFNGRALIAPFVKSPIWYDVSVAGNFNRQQAEEVALILSSGNLPAPVRVVDDGAY